MTRRKLSLANSVKGQSKLSSYFTPKAPEKPNAVTNKTCSAASTTCDSVKGKAAVSENASKECMSTKRSLGDVEADAASCSPLVQPEKKAKLSGSKSEDPDIILCTPEDKAPKCRKPSTSKSKRKISFPPSSVLLKGQDKSPVNSETAVQRNSDKRTISPLKKKVSVSTEVPQQGNCDKPNKYSTEDDPFLAEILGDISSNNSSDTNQTNENKALKASKVLQEDKQVDTVSLANKQCDRNEQQGAWKNFKSSESKSAHSVSKLEETNTLIRTWDHSTQTSRESSTTKNSNGILRDSTSSKSSPNKADTCQASGRKSEEKSRNIFLDSDGETLANAFFEKKTSNKKKYLGSNSKQAKILENKPQELSTKDSVFSKIFPPDVQNVHASVDNNPTLSLLKNKLLNKLSSKGDQVSQSNDCKDKLCYEKKIFEEDEIKERNLKEKPLGPSIDVASMETKTSLSESRESTSEFAKPMDKDVKKESSMSLPVKDSTDQKLNNTPSPGDSFGELDMECFDDDWTLTQFQIDKKTLPPSYEESLDLTSAVHCKVLSIDITKPHQEWKMWIKCVQTEKTASCTVRGQWVMLSLQCEDLICVEAILADKTCLTRWLIDNTHGMLVIHPNTLISGTAVVGSLFCSRRSVLADSFRGVDGSNDVMTIGTVVHEILQEVLKKNIRNLQDIKSKAEEMLSDSNTIRMCYEADLSLAHLRNELNLFLPSIESFVSKYVRIEEPARKGSYLAAPGKTSNPKGKYGDYKHGGGEWSGNIVGIEDIEENLWDPMLGIKGKVDVTVKVQGNKGKDKILPLELKTGRASHSAEHRGQVMLYSMMMSRLGEPVDSGLLLYLRESSIREVKLSHQEKRDLLMLRNRLAQNLKIESKVDIGDIENVPALPNPINFEKACSKCPYLTLCSVHIKKEKNIELGDSHPMQSLSVESTKHLTSAHLDYFFFWKQLIRLEAQEEKNNGVKFFWNLTPEKREKIGIALVHLRIDGDVTEDAGKFVHKFVRNHDVEVFGSQTLIDDFHKCCLSIGNYIIVSTDKRIAVDTGFVLDIDSKSVVLALNRDLRKRNANGIFHLNTYESTYAMTSNLTSLSCLLDDTDRAKRVREAVIERIPPTFSKTISKDAMEELKPILRNLNSAQREAAMAVLKSDRYALIKGLPGTGKTATMVALVSLLVKLGQSVLITSHTHSAVDNLLLRLKQKGVNFLRLGSLTKIHPELEENSEGFVTRHCRTPEDMAATLETYQVVGVTCLGMNHPLFIRGRVFDICLIDESTQVLQTTAVRPLLSAHRFVLVGDPDQLPPVVRSPLARQLGFDESLFARLDTGSATKSLDLNYRMNQSITTLANDVTYKGSLKCGSTEVANAVLNLPSLQDVMKELPQSSWLNKVLEPSMSASVLFLDSGGTHIEAPKGWDCFAFDIAGKANANIVNFFEVEVLKRILILFFKAGIDKNDIGVIAPYRAQISLIRKVFDQSEKLSKIEVNSVDQYQGRDKQVILYSCTRSGSCDKAPRVNEILNDHRRLTVAITRAKVKLIIIGDYSTLKNYAPFTRLLSSLSAGQKVDIPPEL